MSCEFRHPENTAQCYHYYVVSYQWVTSSPKTAGETAPLPGKGSSTTSQVLILNWVSVHVPWGFAINAMRYNGANRVAHNGVPWAHPAAKEATRKTDHTAH